MGRGPPTERGVGETEKREKRERVRKLDVEEEKKQERDKGLVMGREQGIR